MKWILRWSLTGCLLTQSVAVGGGYFFLTTDYPAQYSVHGSDWLARFEYFRVFDGVKKTHTAFFRGKAYQIHWDAEALRFRVMQQEELLAEWSLRPFLQPGNKTLPQEQLTGLALSPLAELKSYIEDVSWEQDGASIKILHFKADFVFRDKRLKN